MRSWSGPTALPLDDCEGPSISAFSGVGVEESPILESGRGDSELDLDMMSTSSAIITAAAVAAEDPASELTTSRDDASLSTCISSSKPSLSGRQDEVDARSSSGQEELCDRGGNSGGGLLDGVGIVDNSRYVM